MSRWRVAARLARREVRRHLARSLLVVLIITLPVLAAQAGVLAWQSARTYNDEILADEIIDDGGTWSGDASLAGADGMQGYDPRFGPPEAPPGTEREDTGFSIQDWTRARDGRGEGPDDLARVELVAYIAEGDVPAAASGATPTTRRQVMIGHELAEATGLRPGDTLRAEASRVDLEVTGIADTGETFGQYAWVGPPVDGDDWVPDTVVRLRESGSLLINAELYALYWEPPRPDPVITDQPSIDQDHLARTDRSEQIEAVVITTATTTMVVGFVAITCSSAFAIGARRQLRQLGTLSAAGAGPADLRRAVLLQGTTLGLAGAAVATTIIYALRAVLVHQLDVTDGEWWFFERSERGWEVPLAPGWVLGIAALGVLAGTCAALVPAFTASRVPVLSALAGRRPLRKRRMRSPYIGGAVLAAGLTLLSWSSARPDGDPSSRTVWVVLAVLLTMTGTVALAPSVVAAVSGLCARLGGTTRLAGRSLIRNSMRTGAVVATTAVAVALPAIVLVWEARDLNDSHMSSDARTQREAVEDALYEVGQVTVGGGEASTAVDQRVLEVVGDDVVVAHQLDGRYGGTTGSDMAVDPEQLRRVTGDDLVADALARGDLVSIGRLRTGMLHSWFYDGHDGAQVDLTDRDSFVVGVDDVSPLTLLLLDQAEHGLVAYPDDGAPRATLFSRYGSFTDEEVDAFYSVQGQAGTPTLDTLRELEASPDLSSVTISVQDVYRTTRSPAPFAVLGAALLALAVIGTAMALAAADGRSDDQVVAAVGAPPGVIRRRRVLEAAMTAGAAAVLGVAVGVTATMVVIHNPGISQDGERVSLPILEVLGTAGGIVALVGGATWLVLAIGGRLRGRSDLFLVDG